MAQNFQIMNNIVQLENNTSALQLLAAQRRLYQLAKRFDTSNIIICIALVVAFSYVETIVDISILPFISLYYLIAFIMGFILDHYKDKNIERAAKMQQMFDTTVYGMEWDYITIGKRLDSSFITEYGYNITDSLRNWYPVEISKLELKPAILVCQKINCIYDKKLRLCYRNGLLFFAFLSAVLIIIFSLLNNHSLHIVLCSIILPIMPIGRCAYLKCKSYNQTIRNLESLNEIIDDYLDMPSKITWKALNAIQNKIYSHRKTNQPIPTWFYRSMRPKGEKQMGELVSRYIGQIGKE